jgi:hypothetical protein
LTVETNIRIDFDVEDIESAIDTINRIGFKNILYDGIKTGLEAKLGKVENYDITLSNGRD